MSHRLVSARGAYVNSASRSSSASENRLVGINIAPATNFASSRESGGRPQVSVSGNLDEQVLRLVETYDSEEDEKLERLLRPLDSHCGQFGKNKAFDKRSRSSENLELLLADDANECFDPVQKRISTNVKDIGRGDHHCKSLHGSAESVVMVDKSLESLKQPFSNENLFINGSFESLRRGNELANNRHVPNNATEYRGSKEAETALTFEDPGSDSSESDTEFYRKLRMNQKKVIAPKCHPNYAGPTVRDELTITDLPEIEELKNLTLDDEAYMQLVGHVMSVVGVLAVVKSANEAMALDADTILFHEDKTVFGKVFEVFGPVKDPFYSIRFNNEEDIKEKGVKVGLKVYCCLSDFDLTKVVFQSDLDKVKGSDASWSNNHEPPEHALQYSDDDQERQAKRERAIRNRAKRLEENLNSDDQESDESEVDEAGSCEESDDSGCNRSGMNKKQVWKKGKGKSIKGKNASQTKGSGMTKNILDETESLANLPTKVTRVNGMSLENREFETDGTVGFVERKKHMKDVSKTKRRQRGGNKDSSTNNEAPSEPIDVLYMKQLQKKSHKPETGTVHPPPINWNSGDCNSSRSVNYQWRDNVFTRTSDAYERKAASSRNDSAFESSASWNRPFNPQNAAFAHQSPNSASPVPTQHAFPSSFTPTNGPFMNARPPTMPVARSPSTFSSEVPQSFNFGVLRPPVFIPNPGHPTSFPGSNSGATFGNTSPHRPFVHMNHGVSANSGSGFFGPALRSQSPFFNASATIAAHPGYSMNNQRSNYVSFSGSH